MGSFFTPGKNFYYWALSSYLADEHVYIKDGTLLPYTPNAQHLYVAYYPSLYNSSVPTTLFFFINDNPAGRADITTPDGFVYLQINLPKGKFTFKTTDATGKLLRTEGFFTKTYAMFFDVAAQTFEQRAVDLVQIQNDLSYQSIRTSRLYPVVGVFFDFPPPPGWTNDQYRSAILGGCGPGFIEAFWYGSVKKGLKDAIASLTCVAPTTQPVKNGKTWVLYDQDSSPDPTDPGSFAWVIRDTPAVPNHQNIELFDEDYLATAVDVIVPNSSRVVSNESVVKQTDNFIQTPPRGYFFLDTKVLTLTVEFLDDPASAVTYTTTFSEWGGPRPPWAAASEIVAQNPALGSYDAGGGVLRILISPVLNRPQRLTIIGGSAVDALGFTVGEFVDISADHLNNPWIQTPVTITFGATTYVQGIDYTMDNNTGQILWIDNGNLLPPKGSSFLCSYSYQMRREIEKIAALITEATSTLNFIYS